MKFFNCILLLWLLLQTFSPIDVDGDEQQRKTECAYSMIQIENLFGIEKLMLDNLENYAEKLKHKLQIIRRGIAAMRAEHLKSQRDPDKYISIPINSYSLVRRLQMDWPAWRDFVAKPIGEENLRILHSFDADLPKHDDLVDAAMGINRLLDFYLIEASDFARGLLRGKRYDAKFTSIDCYSIGTILHPTVGARLAEPWIKLAFQLYENAEKANHIILNYTQSTIVELYAGIMKKEDIVGDAVELLKTAPGNYSKDYHLPETTLTHAVTKAACRGGLALLPTKLHCLYKRAPTPFLRLAPIKMEVLCINPYVVLYHDIISDNTIAELKSQSRPWLKRALTSNSELKWKRTASNFWLGYNLSETTKRIQYQLADMTSLNMQGAEELQIANYGLGGHYDLHYDYFIETEKEFAKCGNRIATVLYYLNDVEQGGATVFPYLLTAVFPKKGSALFWYNMNHKGVADETTYHCACPVLVGHKWVCNVWFREREQLFHRPCIRH